jgi:predicted ester cyclase
MLLKEIADKFIKANDEFVKGNMNLFDEIYVPDILSHSFPFPDTHGLDALKRAKAASLQGLSDIAIDWQEVVTEGNTTAHRYTWHAHYIGTLPMSPTPARSEEIGGATSVFYHVKNNKIVEEFWCASPPIRLNHTITK